MAEFLMLAVHAGVITLHLVLTKKIRNRR